ncbi:hypothetical protein BH11PSE4_BH11PSE4_13950 [soil metagenome]
MSASPHVSRTRCGILFAAAQIRDPGCFCATNRGPGSAKQYFVLHRVRGTEVLR